MASSRAITPRPFKLTKGVFTKIMKSVADEMQQDFEATTATWKHKPSFVKSVQVGANLTHILVYTTDTIYGYVNYGTRAHIILPKRARFLRFRVKGLIGKSRDGFVYARAVAHPGFKGRQFTAILKRKWEPRLTMAVVSEVKRLVQESGHAL